MTIFIEREVTVSPAAVELPATIDLCTALRSDRGERVAAFYRLADDHAVWFAGENGQPAKSWASFHDVGAPPASIATPYGWSPGRGGRWPACASSR